MKRSFEVSTLIWPAIVQSQHSEKPSILKVIDDIVGKIVKNVETTAIEIKVHMSLVLRKSVFGVSDQVRHKPACTATEAS